MINTLMQSWSLLMHDNLPYPHLSSNPVLPCECPRLRAASSLVRTLHPARHPLSHLPRSIRSAVYHIIPSLTSLSIIIIDLLPMRTDEWEILPDNKPLDPRCGIVDMQYFTLRSENSSEGVVSEEEINPEPEQYMEVQISIATPAALASLIYQVFRDTEEEGGGSLDHGETGAEAEGEDYVMVPECEEKKGGFSLSNWASKLMGAGALRSIGVAAATICVLIVSGRQWNKYKEMKQEARQGGGGGARAAGDGVRFGNFYGVSDALESVLEDGVF